MLLHAAARPARTAGSARRDRRRTIRLRPTARRRARRPPRKSRLRPPRGATSRRPHPRDARPARGDRSRTRAVAAGSAPLSRPRSRPRLGSGHARRAPPRPGPRRREVWPKQASRSGSPTTLPTRSPPRPRPAPRTQGTSVPSPSASIPHRSEISSLTPSVRPDDSDSMIADVDDRRIGLRARAGPVGRTVTSSHTGVSERAFARRHPTWTRDAGDVSLNVHRVMGDTPPVAESNVICAACGQAIDASGAGVMTWDSGEKAGYVPFLEDLRTNPVLLHIGCYVDSRGLP